MNETRIRVSRPILKMLKLMIEKPQTPFSGAEIARAAELGPGTLYPALRRLENAGWLKSNWEDVDPAQVGRPKRRLYKLTGQGQTEAVKALAELQMSVGVLGWAS